MPEQDSRTVSYDNINISSEIIELSVLRLISLFLADKEMQKLYSKGHFAGSWSILDEIREIQIIHHIIEIATLYRTEEYKIDIPREIKKKEQEKLIVGKLFEPISKPAKPLTMIEACNKVIHATTMNYDMRKLPSSDYSYFYPTVYLYGKKGRTRWRAILNIKKYCEKALRMEPPNPISNLNKKALTSH
jgi:hypothetical protein